MRLSLGKAVAALLACQAVEGSFLRDVVVGSSKSTKISLEQELLAKAIPLDDYRANLRTRGYDIVQDTRNLEQAANNAAAVDDYYLDENYMYSFSGYSLKYAACQPVQQFSEEAVAAGEYTPMITDDIVILRLCPSSSCSSNRAFGCLYNYAEYAVAVNDYVRIMLRHKMDKQQQLCNWCATCSGQRNLNEGEANQDAQGQNEAANGDEANQEAQDQGEENQQQDMNQEQVEAEEAVVDEGDDGVVGDDGVADEAAADQAAGDDGTSSGYVADDDNGSYSQGDSCYQYKSYCYSDGVSVCAADTDDGSSYLATEDYLNYMECSLSNGYYLRPRCNGYDHSISMGIYYDKFCSQYAGDKVNMNSLGLGISPTAFQDFTKSACMDCSESNAAPYFNSNANMCNRMHRSSARCTTSLQYELFDSDTSDESTSCSFIESLRFGTYDEEGRLYTEEFGSASRREMTVGQKVGLAATIAVCVYLAIYSCYLHHAITNLLVRSLSHTELLPPRSRQRKARSRSNRRQIESDTEEEDWKEVKKTSRRGSGSARR